MARTPPTDDGEPDLIEFGIPIVDDHLEAADLSFPADRHEVEAAVGAVEVPSDASGRTVTLSRALDGVEADRFETKTELLDALHPVFEDARERTSSGLVATLQSYLPF